MQKLIATVAVIAGANAVEVEAQRSEPIYHDHSYAHVDHHEEIGNDGYVKKDRGFSYGAMPSKPIHAKCILKDPEEEAQLGGTISLEQWPGKATSFKGEIWGITTGEHGFHVHALGDQRDGCASLGAHFDPLNLHDHGAHESGALPIGDLKNVWADDYGTAIVDQSSDKIDLYGGQSIIGRSLVIHAQHPTDPKKSGARVGCCTIGLAAGPEPKYDDKPAVNAYQPQQQYYGNQAW